MNTKNFKISVLILAALAVGAWVKPMYHDVKLATQAVMERQSIIDADAAGSADVLSGNAGATSAAVATVSSFVAQPDVPRNLVITPGTSTPDVGACTIVVAGLNIYGRAITEDFAFSADASSATTGAKAFKSVSSITFPANCETTPFAATWSVGYGEKLGLNHCLDYAGDWVFSEIGGAYEATRATVVADADEVEKNTADFNGTMTGSADFLAHFIQNFRCNP